MPPGSCDRICAGRVRDRAFSNLILQVRAGVADPDIDEDEAPGKTARPALRVAAAFTELAEAI